ncbi:MAG: LysR family transcriptional regulator [Nocardiopsaceae bacterium]|nr:LysR family transcriptional regulator [Nocardiopsaceae bacterium]
MTLTQLSAFVLVARLGSVKEAASALGVSEPAVSQALAALRNHFGDPLIERGPGGMALTPGGARLMPIASQVVRLGNEAEAVVRAAKGAPDQLRMVATSPVAEFLATPVIDAFTARMNTSIEHSVGVATHDQIPLLVADRLADLGLGIRRGGTDPATGTVSDPVFRCRIIVVAAAKARIRGDVARVPWLVDPSGTDPASDVAALLRRLNVPESRVRVFPNQTAAWAAAAEGAGVAPAIAHLVRPQVQRGDLAVITTPATPMDETWCVTMPSSEIRSVVATGFHRFLKTPEALYLLQRPSSGIPAARFRPPVHVTIWN